MYQNFIKNYIRQLKIDDIYRFCEKENICAKETDIEVVYNYLKMFNDSIVNDPLFHLEEIKNKVSPEGYKIILKLYDKYKKLVNF